MAVELGTLLYFIPTIQYFIRADTTGIFLPHGCSLAIADQDYLLFIVVIRMRSSRTFILRILHIICCNLKEMCISDGDTSGGEVPRV